jgi:epoxyqueuosine reductase QueG
MSRPKRRKAAAYFIASAEVIAIGKEISRSVSKLDSIFEKGSEKIQQRLQVCDMCSCRCCVSRQSSPITQEDIRKKEAAAQVLKTQLFNLCEENKRKTAEDLRTSFL